MANLKDLLVNGNARVIGTLYADVTGNLTGNVTGNTSGTAGSATKLTTARKTYVTLGTASTTTTRDWSGDTTIPVSGTLAVANGGTGATSFTANSVIMSGNTTTAALTTRAITNNTSASAVTGTTNLITENTLKFYNGAYDANGNSSITKVGTIDNGTWQGTAIAESYIASNAVTTAKIKDANVTTAKIADANVTSAKLADSGATAGSYGDSANQTPAYGATFKVPYVTVNAKGLVTGISEHTVKIPASDNTNTWRGIQDNLTSSTNTTESLSAKQGYLLANGSARDSTKLPLSGGTITGDLLINTNTEEFGLIVSRNNGTSESAKHSVNDSQYNILYTNDEDASSIRFILQNTDTERATNKGADASTNVVSFSSNKSGVTITANTFSGALSGNATSATTATNYAATGGIADALEGKASSSHEHSISNVTNLQSTLNDKANKTTNIASSDKGVALGGTIGSPTITVTSGSVAANDTSVVTGGVVHQAIKDILIDYRTTSNTFTQKNTFSYSGAVDASSDAANATINISAGGLVAASGIRAAKIYNSVWNDLVDCIPVDNRCLLEYGYCYCFDGERYYKSNGYAERGIIGIHSDTAGFEMGHKSNTDELHCAVAGFCLAYVDKEYAPGTPLTCGKNGILTRMRLIDRIIHPERIVATYWKNEESELWGPPSDKIKVNGRKWVKVI